MHHLLLSKPCSHTPTPLSTVALRVCSSANPSPQWPCVCVHLLTPLHSGFACVHLQCIRYTPHDCHSLFVLEPFVHPCTLCCTPTTQHTNHLVVLTFAQLGLPPPPFLSYMTKNYVDKLIQTPHKCASPPDHAHIYVHTCTHAHTHAHIYVHTCTHLHTCTHTNTHTCTHAHMHTHTHMRTHTLTQTHRSPLTLSTVAGTERGIRGGCMGNGSRKAGGPGVGAPTRSTA
jgi:hypothetical protein